MGEEGRVPACGRADEQKMDALQLRLKLEGMESALAKNEAALKEKITYERSKPAGRIAQSNPKGLGAKAVRNVGYKKEAEEIQASE